MEELRETSDVIIDTSELNIHQLATAITETFAESEDPGVQVTVLSFGFKYGLPTDADMVGDARFLPNPFWVPELRAQSGLDEPVTSYVMAQQGLADSSRRSAPPSSPCSRAISVRTRDTLRSPLAARAASIDRSPSSVNWQRICASSVVWPSA